MMKQIRFLSILMAVILCITSVGFLSFAEEAGSTSTTNGTGGTAALQPEEIPNDLLLDLNLNGDANYAPSLLKSTGGRATVSADGDSVLLECLKTSSRNATHLLYWGGLTNLPLDGSSYTITFAVENAAGSQFGFLWDYDGTDAANSNGFKGTPDSFETVTVSLADDAEGKRYYCVEIDGKAAVLNLYVLYGGEYQLVVSKAFANPLSSNVAPIFYLLGGKNPTAAAGTLLSAITVSDVNIYGGLYRGAISYNQQPEANGELLLEVKDLQKDAFNAKSGVGYRQSVAQLSTGAYENSFYSYDAENNVMNTTLLNQSKGYSVVFGGATNLLLTETSKYTVSYYQTLTKAGGAGLRVSIGNSYSDSVGVYLHQSVGTGGCLAWGANTSPGYSGYKKFSGGMMQNSTVYWQDEEYAKVDIEINGTVISVYINDVFFFSEDITRPSNPSAKEDITKGFMSETLCLVFHEYGNAGLTGGAHSTKIKGLKVYSGLLHQECYDVKAYTPQIGTVANGKLNLRFVGGGFNATYNRVGFEITAVYGEKSDRYDYNTPESYLKLTAPNKDAALAVLQAADMNCDFLYGYTLYGIPTDITVTFTITPYAVSMGNRLYGESITVTLENGVLK